MLVTRGLFGAGAFAVLLAAVSLFASGAEAQAPARATCTTFNASNEPASAFDAGDEIIVRGTGFGSKSLVFVRFEQGARTAELARADANDLGALAAPKAEIPGSVVDGPASIIALDARGSATCEITVREVAADEGGDLGGLYLVWGSALAIFAVILGVLTYRRWKAERLNEAMEHLGRRERPEEGPGRQKDGPKEEDEAAGTWELDPWESEQAAMERSGSRDVEGPADDRPQPEPRPKQQPVTFPIGPEEDDADDDRWIEPVEDEEPSPAVPEVPEAPEVKEPPRLPDGWDSGRLRPSRQASDAIERLRREVRTWGRS
jgi:hypothetical protein